MNLVSQFVLFTVEYFPHYQDKGFVAPPDILFHAYAVVLSDSAVNPFTLRRFHTFFFVGGWLWKRKSISDKGRLMYNFIVLADGSF